MQLVPVTSVNDVGLASIIKGVLEQAGIPVVVGGSGAEDAFPPGTIDSLHILVAEGDVQKALDLLDQYETSLETEDDEE
jgi:hypothetical protein